MAEEILVRKYRKKDAEPQSAKAKQLVDVLLGHLGFDPLKYALFEVCDQELSKLVKGCRAVAVRGKKLYLQVPSPMHRQDLIYSRKKIIERLNQVFGRECIDELHFEFSPAPQKSSSHARN